MYVVVYRGQSDKGAVCLDYVGVAFIIRGVGLGFSLRRVPPRDVYLFRRYSFSWRDINRLSVNTYANYKRIAFNLDGLEKVLTLFQ